MLGILSPVGSSYTKNNNFKLIGKCLIEIEYSCEKIKIFTVDHFAFKNLAYL